MRSLTTLLVFAALTGRANADSCKPAEVRKFLLAMEHVGTAALEGASTCMFEGPNDAAIAKFEKIAHGELAKATAAVADLVVPASCLKTRVYVQQVGEMIAQTMGVRVGLAYRTCSTKIVARVAELVKQNKTDPEINTEVQALIKPMFDALADNGPPKKQLVEPVKIEKKK